MSESVYLIREMRIRDRVYTMQFDSYEPVPKNVQDEIISKAGGNA